MTMTSKNCVVFVKQRYCLFNQTKVLRTQINISNSSKVDLIVRAKTVIGVIRRFIVQLHHFVITGVSRILSHKSRKPCLSTVCGELNVPVLSFAFVCILGSIFFTLFISCCYIYNSCLSKEERE